MTAENPIDSFDNVTLEDLKKVKLLNRRDTKYVIPVGELDTLLSHLQTDYRVLQIDAHRSMEYDTSYFDTENFDFYTVHQNGKKNRFKVRYRRYLNNNQSFLELKRKNNKGRTDKTRRKMDPGKTPGADYVTEFVKGEVASFEGKVRESLNVRFARITLCDNKFKERITIDRDLSFRRGEDEASCPGLAIIEVKQDQFEKNSPIITHLRESGYRPFRISKYCLGIYAMNRSYKIKTNQMKKKVHLLGKRINGKVVI